MCGHPSAIVTEHVLLPIAHRGSQLPSLVLTRRVPRRDSGVTANGKPERVHCHGPLPAAARYGTPHERAPRPAARPGVPQLAGAPSPSPKPHTPGSLNWLVCQALALSHTSSPELQPSTGWSAGQPHCTALRSTNGNLAFGWWQVGLLDWKSPQMPVQQRTRSFINPSRAVVTGNLSD